MEEPRSFDYCRRGAIYRKLGKIKEAIDNLNKVTIKFLKFLLFKGSFVVINFHMMMILNFPYQNDVKCSNLYQLLCTVSKLTIAV